ncbi:hypothetical protein [Kineosporia babensis]|uniref:Secreted protein n=1 Tax=Kineosporia babensis TaxID=499548 RepID=A0A9X1NJ39_9ACTN|nr:hypothetical protein [Kineosporia babensis]MCD5314524.1 hypothetical protein [Kineosporia babensis]
MTAATLLGASALTLGSASVASAAVAGDPTGSTGTEVCAPNGNEVPQGAAFAGAGDVDGDGANDEVWVSDSLKGIRTASGAVYSQPIANAGGPEVGVRVLHLNHDVVALIEQGRSTYVTAFADCGLVDTYDKDGQPLRYDRGLSDPYRDLGCIGDDDYSELNELTLGYDLSFKDQPWSVEQTVLEVTEDGTGATGIDGSVNRYPTEEQARAALDELAAGNTCSTEVATLA